ncbi:GNAT family N-acetyltransferase [Pseudomonas gingeri NCPPB 3146 = LMG 5327]|uniref:GNAT family N-acetyltransferase n=2 Tax=Pseudomonas gingeri TaxID=117681 RepID=A0A7Y7Y434_9PSED|nr:MULTISPECIES: GNAT family N-acetyltransferase [Pseudomonas]NVZ27665.1 GNAT family N-acetyltransferase [Pseudomonas gingeri]NWA05684.1 GNAT family N-acetyltransferase [Pseudomonas gingeri]NWC17499.1 GNAT family N-acetyltransferase [Pseudomonas gingeri]NWE67845.1 GNAT family N-acetyltransferase [Pseudomonas gingeri]PNQ88115.1 GNAT family N-acetyltransferase [Pseudomonas gingeri NCPPB 3146 = LMG 5327]
MTVTFRPALRTDAREIARLFQISSEGAADYIWSRIAEEGESLLDVGERRYRREGVEFSYENCLMAEAGGQVIGMLHSYPMLHDPDPAPATDPVLAPYADLEIPDTLYISSLALHEGWRNQGLGARFLALARQRCAALGLKGLSLIDYAMNSGACRFYTRHGFRIVGECQVVPHPLIRVTGAAYLMHWSAEVPA